MPGLVQHHARGAERREKTIFLRAEAWFPLTYGAILPRSTPMQPLAPGAVLLDGRFVIVRLLAHGGQATTYEGIDKLDGTRVAIKRFVVRGASSWKDVELAEREARVLSGLSHPAIPRHVSHFEEQGELFLVTEYIDGQTLDELGKRKTSSLTTTAASLSQTDVVNYLFAMSDVLDYLHTQSPPIIHRDIKPKNVIRRSDGTFVLVDFGSVRERLKPEGGSTVVGTFGYMAPEQFQGRAFPATDTYAAAATALALLTGRDPDQLPHQGLKLDVERALGSSVSAELKRVLNSALEPDPDKRAQRLSQLLRNSSLRTAKGRESTSSGSPWSTSHSKAAGAQTSEFGADAATGTVPFRTHGYQRPRTPEQQRRAQQRLDEEFQRAHERADRDARRANERAARDERRAHERAARDERRAYTRAARHERRQARGNPNDYAIPMPVIDVETPLRRALREVHVKRWLRVPWIALLLTMLFVVVRFALWLALGIVIPVVLLLLHRVFDAPVLDEARRSRHIARQLRSQMRRVSHVLTEGSEVTEPEVRFRVESTVTDPPSAQRHSTAEFARQFDEEAVDLENQLDEAVEKIGRK